MDLQGTSKGFGFAQFTSTELAKAFVDPLFPFVQVPPPASHGASATATFYKALETGVPHNGRRVKIDYSQSATPHDRGRSNRGNVNDGTRDIGNTQSPILLLRGLDPLSGPQAIYQAMLYSSGSGPGKQGPRGMRRIILIKDKVTMASYGFAFVEFVDVQVSSNVAPKTTSLKYFLVGLSGTSGHNVTTASPKWISDFGQTCRSVLCSPPLFSTCHRLYTTR